ncbi:integrator complex subunit 1 [Phthorimaea operculella]|nr:integrator complex subunit 1 [Phthorimaea operculella]
MERGKMSSAGRGGKSKAPQHPQDIFALGSKSTVVVSSSEKRNIHKPSSSGVERKRESTTFGSQPPTKRSRIGSPAEAVGGASLDVEPVDLVPNVLQALDTHNSDKLLGLLTGSIRLLKSQRSKPDPILCMSMLYLTKIRPNMFAHEVVTQALCTLLKREQGAAFKSKGNPLVFVLACNMLYAGHKDSMNWPDTFIKVYIEDALNERWWVECSWCKCLVENIVTAFNTKTPPSHLIPSDNTLGTMSPSGSGSPLMGSTEDETDNTELEYSVFPRYSSSYETVEGLVLEAIKEQIQRRAAPDAIGKGFLKLLSATCGFPEIRMISASRLEAWLHSGKLWRCAQELLAYVCCNADACGPTAARDHEVLAQLARMRLKTKPLQAAYQSCLREMVSDSPALLRSVVTHTIYNELSNVRSPNNMAVLCALIQAQPQLVPAAMAHTYQELLLRPEDYLRPLRALTRECVRAARADAQALLPLARALATPPPHEPPNEVRERAFSSLADLFCCCCMVTASHSKHLPEYKQQLCVIQGCAIGWLLETAMPMYRPSRHDFQHALNKIMFVESADTYSKADNWPPESERALTYRLCCEAPLPQNTLLRVIFIGLSKDTPVAPAEVFELVEQLVRRACALPPEENPLQVDKLDIAEYIFQLCQFNPPDNITLPAGYTPPPLAITSLYWRGWILLAMLAAHNPNGFAEQATATYPTLRSLTETCITGKPSIEWSNSTAAEAERAEAERAAILQLETHLATASNAKLPITEHTSRLLSQLTTLDPLGPPRKPPQTVIDTVIQLSQQLRLGKLLCRAPALLLELVERHGTRRAMPWLHQLLKHDQLELSVLPVQCLCEFLSASGGSGGVGSEAGKIGELCAHLRRTVHHSEEGARAVLHYYMQRLAHTHSQTRSSASRGLKLVLTQSTDETIEMDYNAEVSPDEWLDLLWDLQHWEAVKEEVVVRIRAACLVECTPSHLAAYIHFLAKLVASQPLEQHAEIVQDLSQVLMERTTVMGWVLPPAEMRSPPVEPKPEQHKTLHALTQILYQHMQKLFAESATAEPDPEGLYAAGERVQLQWRSGRRVTVHVIVAHAHLKLLCYGPSMYDTNQEMYNWLQSIWVGNDAPEDFLGDSELLADWLRLHLVRSARPALLEAGLRGLPAHKLALFIQTFGMPVSSMSALLSALDACSAGAVSRLGVERAYMAQLLRVQRARGARGGAAFANALRLQPPQYPPDDNLFEDEPLPEESVDAWAEVSTPATLQLGLVGPLLQTAFGNAVTFQGDMDQAFTLLNAAITEESKKLLSGEMVAPYTEIVVQFLASPLATNLVRRPAYAAPLLRALLPTNNKQMRFFLASPLATNLVRRPAYAAPLLRALLPTNNKQMRFIAENLLRQYKCLSGPVVSVLRALAAGKTSVNNETPNIEVPPVPKQATKSELIQALESATPGTLEALGNRIIATQDTQLIVDVISTLLEKNQEGHYELKVKTEDQYEVAQHVFSRRGLGCGLLLDWLSELQKETLGVQPQQQMKLMFRSLGSGSEGAVGAMWRPLLVTLLAHRASWRTLRHCLTSLLEPSGGWAASAVLDFAETLVSSPRIWQGRDRNTPKHYTYEDTLRLSHEQLDVLIRYIVKEAEEAEHSSTGVGGSEAVRLKIESRLPLLLRCCNTPQALLAAAISAAQHHPLLLLLTYMKVPKILQLLKECEDRPPTKPLLQCPEDLMEVAARSTCATDRVSHTLLTALSQSGHRDSQKSWRMSAGVRALWARVEGAGVRALPLAAALLRGSIYSKHNKHHQHLLDALEMLPDDKLFASGTLDEVHNVLECFLNMAKQQTSNRDSAMLHRTATLLRRYRARRPQKAAQLLNQTLQSTPALSWLSAADDVSSSASPPPQALRTLQKRSVDTDADELQYVLQEIEAWGVRRGGAWGGAACAQTLLRCSAPLAAHPAAHVRDAALGLLAKLLPAVPDTKPGLQAILEGLDSTQPEVVQAVIDKIPELIVGIQEHATKILMKVFCLGVQSRHPVESCISKCVVTINSHRGC